MLTAMNGEGSSATYLSARQAELHLSLEEVLSQELSPFMAMEEKK